MSIFNTLALFFITAFFEILGCYLPFLVLKQNKSVFLLIPSFISLSLFAWLLTLHPTPSGRTYASYAGVYLVVAIMWLYFIDKISLTKYDIIGSLVAFLGIIIIIAQPKLIN